MANFFPFNKGEEVFDIEETSNQLVAKNINSNNEILNHYLGMTLEAKFTQPEKGQAQNEETKQEQDMIFTFTGDDDIWIYIDNILVADLGGIHNALTAEINFATGKITIKTKRQYCNFINPQPKNIFRRYIIIKSQLNIQSNI